MKDAPSPSGAQCALREFCAGGTADAACLPGLGLRAPGLGGPVISRLLVLLLWTPPPLSLTLSVYGFLKLSLLRHWRGDWGGRERRQVQFSNGHLHADIPTTFVMKTVGQGAGRGGMSGFLLRKMPAGVFT